MTRVLHKKIVTSGATVKGSELPEIYTHKAPIHQVLQNRVENSIKYSREGVPPEILISAHQSDNKTVVSVRDKGFGIDQQYFEKVFIIFQRLHTNSEIQGSGVGLSVCKKIVEGLGGYIWSEVTESDGTEIRISIPAMRNVSPQAS